MSSSIILTQYNCRAEFKNLANFASEHRPTHKPMNDTICTIATSKWINYFQEENPEGIIDIPVKGYEWVSYTCYGSFYFQDVMLSPETFPSLITFATSTLLISVVLSAESII